MGSARPSECSRCRARLPCTSNGCASAVSPPGKSAPLTISRADVDALVMPGGESTTMSKLLTTSGLFDVLASRIEDGMPVFGTCAG